MRVIGQYPTKRSKIPGNARQNMRRPKGSRHMADRSAEIRHIPIVLGAAAMVLGLAASPDADAAAVLKPDTSFASHRALYEMTLRSTEHGSSVADATGTMYYRFEALCGGWEVESRVALQLHYGNVGATEVIETTWTFTSFESYDGTELTYAVDHKRDGMIQEAFAGEAGKDSEGGGASFDDELMTSVALPSETLFPAEHLRMMLDHAKRAKGPFRQVVFDGASTSNPYSVNAFVIGPVRGQHALAANDAASDAANGGGAMLVGAWPASVRPMQTYRIRMAYFPVTGANTVPEFEIEVDYREDGIAERMIQDFGDFALDLTPSKLELLPVAECE